MRAGIVPVGSLPAYRFSSLWYLTRPKQRPGFLQLDAALGDAGGLADTKAGWACYARYLAWQASDGPAGRNQRPELRLDEQGLGPGGTGVQASARQGP